MPVVELDILFRKRRCTVCTLLSSWVWLLVLTVRFFRFTLDAAGSCNSLIFTDVWESGL